MDSRLLYSATSHLNPVIIWDNDWIHFGTDKEIKLDLINKLIDEFLSDENLNLVYNRNHSGTYIRTEILSQIETLLGQDEFQIWNMSLNKVIRFHKIGVLQLGRK